MKVYIAGPMTGVPDWNYPLFRKVAQYLRQRKWEPLSPMELCSHIPQGTDPKVFMKICCQHVSRCEAIIVLDGWDRSKGARAEVAIAVICGLTFYKFVQGPRGNTLEPMDPPKEVTVHPYPNRAA